jgi:elongation factor G
MRSLIKLLAVLFQELTDVKVNIVFGSYHEVDSSEIAFRICGSMALKEAARASGAIILEPIMQVDVNTPEAHMGDVIGDLNRRRGNITGQENLKGSACVVHAEVPLSEMFGYSTQLRSLSSGRAVYSMTPRCFKPVTSKILEELTKK